MNDDGMNFNDISVSLNEGLKVVDYTNNNTSKLISEENLISGLGGSPS